MAETKETEMMYKIEDKDLENYNRIKMKELQVQRFDRDTTIYTVVKSSIIQEKNVNH